VCIGALPDEGPTGQAHTCCGGCWTLIGAPQSTGCDAPRLSPRPARMADHPAATIPRCAGCHTHRAQPGAPQVLSINKGLLVVWFFLRRTTATSAAGTANKKAARCWNHLAAGLGSRTSPEGTCTAMIPHFHCRRRVNRAGSIGRTPRPLHPFTCHVCGWSGQWSGSRCPNPKCGAESHGN
jgi:hypothetical protein